MNDPILQRNFEKIKELQPPLHHAANGWVADCWNRNLCFRIAEVYRTQERQKNLYKIGRRGVRGEDPVSWTLDSDHTRRLAADIDPINCTFEQIEAIGKHYGIERDPQLLRLGDYRHFSFAKAIRTEETQYSPEAQEKRLTRALNRVAGPVKAALLRQLERLKKRIS